MGYKPKRCTVCREWFAPRSPNAKGCSNECRKVVARLGIAKWHAANPEKGRQNCRRYYQKNSEKIRQKTARYQAENPDRVRQRSIRHYAKNLEKVRQSTKKWRTENPDKCAAYNQKHNARYSLAVSIIRNEPFNIPASEVPASQAIACCRDLGIDI